MTEDHVLIRRIQQMTNKRRYSSFDMEWAERDRNFIDWTVEELKRSVYEAFEKKLPEHNEDGTKYLLSAPTATYYLVQVPKGMKDRDLSDEKERFLHTVINEGWEKTSSLSPFYIRTGKKDLAGFLDDGAVLVELEITSYVYEKLQ